MSVVAKLHIGDQHHRTFATLQVSGAARVQRCLCCYCGIYRDDVVVTRDVLYSQNNSLPAAGDGEDLKDIQAYARQKGLNWRWFGGKDHADESMHDYQVGTLIRSRRVSVSLKW